MYAKLIEEFIGESIRYTETEGDSMYYVQIINPTDKEICDAISGDERNTPSSFGGFAGGLVCL